MKQQSLTRGADRPWMAVVRDAAGRACWSGELPLPAVLVLAAVVPQYWPQLQVHCHRPARVVRRRATA